MKEGLEQFIAWTKLKIRIHVSQDQNKYFKEREIWWCSLGKNIGYEQDGKGSVFERPVLILKKFSKHVLWVVPMTSSDKCKKYYFQVTHEGRVYAFILSQLRLISSKRLSRKIRTFPQRKFREVVVSIQNML